MVDNDKAERTRRERAGVGVAQVRTRVAQVVWIVCVVMALFLAIGALTYALGANADNGLVQFVRDGAAVADLDIFSLENGIKEFDGDNADTKTALVNWGIGAIFWLVLGRLLDRLTRP